MPDKGETKVGFNYEELVATVKMAAIFARESANMVRWEIGKGKVIISANSPQVGRNVSEIEAKIDGEGVVVAFNSRFLLDFLLAVDGKKNKEIQFETNGPLAPGLFTLANEKDLIHVIMPVRVQEGS